MYVLFCVCVSVYVCVHICVYVCVHKQGKYNKMENRQTAKNYFYRLPTKTKNATVHNHTQFKNKRMFLQLYHVFILTCSAIRNYGKNLYINTSDSQINATFFIFVIKVPTWVMRCEQAQTPMFDYPGRMSLSYLRSLGCALHEYFMDTSRRSLTYFPCPNSQLKHSFVVSIINTNSNHTSMYHTWWQPDTSTTPLPMRYASMGYTSMGFTSMGYTSTELLNLEVLIVLL